MNNNIAPMPTQNPWAWVWAPNVGLWSTQTPCGCQLLDVCLPLLCWVSPGRHVSSSYSCCLLHMRGCRGWLARVPELGHMCAFSCVEGVP